MPTNVRPVAAQSRQARATNNSDRHSGYELGRQPHPDNVNSLDMLTASIVHEVNQPLSGITINASTCLRMLCADPPNIEGALQTARRTLRDVNRAADVIKRLRALFTEGVERSETVNLNDAVLKVLAMSRNELRRARVRVRHTLAPDLPSFAGDRIQVEQVILNLVRNAIDAMGAVNIRAKTITIVTQSQNNGDVLLSVHDTGVGIGEQALHEVLKPFYSTKPDGMGIGLSVSRSIVESHGGQLWVTLNDGPGVTFWLSIPCMPSTRNEACFRPTIRATAGSNVTPLTCS